MGNTTRNIQVVELAPEQYRQAWDVLARAFFDYPFMTYIQPDPVKRKKILPWYLGFTIRIGRKYGKMLTTPEMKGVVVWLPPKHCWVSIAEFIVVGMLETPFRLGLATCKRILANDNFIEEIRKTKAPEKHWYLWSIGVDPIYKNQGVGAALMEPVLMEADKNEEVCYLETHLEANLAWYQKYGFEVVFDGEIPGYSLPVWGMMRYSH